jgi:hypothetical protein
MTYSVTPSNLTSTTEFANINTSFVVSYTGMGVGTINSLEVTPDPLINGNIIVSIGSLGSSSVTVNLYGMYNDNFDKTITYEDNAGNSQTASRWANVTPNYNLVYEYTPASGGSVTAAYEILVNGADNLTVQQTINNSSYTPGANYLKEYVAGGRV